VIRTLLGGLALACAGFFACANAEGAESPSMRFEWRSEGPADLCGKMCRTWISAVGPVTEKTPRDFAAFAADRDVHGSVMVLDSEGGSVVDTLQLGRTLRRLDITTTIGKTSTAGTGARGRASILPSASCESMCAFILLGGSHRYVPPEARVLVHQIWLAKKRERAETASYAADELVLVERDIGSLARYTIEMGGDIELLEVALRVPPWEPLYRLSRDEIKRMGLNNIDRLFNDQVRDVATTSGLAAPSAPQRGQ
jgi:ATP-dependent protease ClpP protease subunit